METLKRFLCDWGSSDSNMLLFFLLTSFLLGLLTGWLLWGSKIKAMLGILDEKEATITDFNTKLTAKEADLNKANLDLDALRLINKRHEEEKGQLRVDLLENQNLKMELSNHLSSRQEENIQLQTNLLTIEGENAQLSSELVASQGIIDDLEARVNASGSGNLNLVAAAVLAAPIVAAIETQSETEISTIENTENVIDEADVQAEIETGMATVKNVDNSVDNEKIVDNSKEEEEQIALVSKPDDLKIVEGIGPKIEELCNNIGIFTWKQLSETSVESLQEMLNAAGKRYQIHNPATWAEQARMANEGEWDALKIYQDHLKGGKEPGK